MECYKRKKDVELTAKEWNAINEKQIEEAHMFLKEVDASLIIPKEEL